MMCELCRRWLQTKTLFADVRIPHPAPAATVASLETASGPDLLALAEQVNTFSLVSCSMQFTDHEQATPAKEACLFVTQ